VAWSSFITGCNPGRHGLFDFVARDAATVSPYLSTAITKEGTSLNLGNWRLPLSGGIEQARKEKALWEHLASSGISNSFFRLPGNYPCEGAGGTALSGMGTPDLTGGYGSATVFLEREDNPFPNIKGSRVIVQQANNFSFEFSLEGPSNPYQKDDKALEVAVKINKDPSNSVIKLSIADQTLILGEKQWSAWIPVHFSFIPGISGADGMVQCYVRSVHPKLEIYISPVIIDPLANSIPTSEPPAYAQELAKKIGRFNTLGLPADTKSLSNGLLSDEEYLAQARSVLQENMYALDSELAQFSEGLLFFYFSSLDQNQHMLWRCFDSTHPMYDPNAAPELKSAVKMFYVEMDKALARALARVDSRTLVLVLSDHGFLPFTREFQLNTWLREQGYLVLKDNSKAVDELSLISDVDWSKTRAYALGFAGFYLNLKGREPHGIVEATQAPVLLKELSDKLSRTLDPETGLPVGRAVLASEAYQGSEITKSPDIIMAYTPGVRVSDTSILGGFANSTFNPRTNKWAADHCMEPAKVPGVLISSHALSESNPAIWDLAPTILKALSVEAEAENFDGKSLWI
jgi:predicted AlkP superfamily phosphohydrolase/phosphomutase